MAASKLQSTLSQLRQSPRGISRLRKLARKLLFETCEARVVMASDFGDLPDGYGTLLASNGPRHTVTPGVFLGANVDDEVNGQPNATATGDNTNGGTVSPPGDEQGVNFDQPLQPGGVSSLEVSANVNGFLSAWIDFNGNGNFNDAGEYIAGAGALGFPVVVHGIAAGQTRLKFQVPVGSVVGNTYARFRFTTNSGPLTPTGVLAGNIVPDGEVEDYQLTITTPVDFGDAPDSYGTKLASNGARHTIANGLFLGTNVDPEPDAPLRLDMTNPAANVLTDDADEEGNAPLNLNDENGVTFSGPFIAGQQVTATIVASAAGKLDAWVDYNQDGDFGDTGEKIASNLSVTAGNNTLTLLVPAIAVPGSNSFARFRISTAGNLGATGPAVDGEVEDYPLTIQPGVDFGDAPQPYPTASHDIVPGFHLGGRVDPEPTSQVIDVNALGDDQLGGPDDEDGVATSRTLVTGTNHNITITSANAGFVDAWVDFDANGVWGDSPGEQIFTSQLVNPGTNTLTFAVPAGLTPAKTFARFRFSQTGGVAFNGNVVNGEVEDYEFAIGAQDFGDAADTYKTLEASGGAAHVNVGGANPFIGVAPSSETDGQPSAAANLDTDDGLFHDAAATTQPLGATIPLIAGTNTLFVQSTTSPVAAFLNAWIDFNHNGTFEPTEQIAVDLPLPTGVVNPLPFVVPGTAVFGDTVARFRVSTETGLSPIGLARDGEVEDYVVNLAATALDFGDAPDTYGTLLASNGPRHTIPRQESTILLGGTTNGSFEGASPTNLLGWTIGGNAGRVEVLQASNFSTPIAATAGSSYALLSTGPGTISGTPQGNIDNDPAPVSNEFDVSTLNTQITVTAAQVPAILSFDWNFLTTQANFGSDDIFQVNFGGTPILQQSVRSTNFSPFPNTLATDFVPQTVTSTGLTNGSTFFNGQTGFRTFQFLVTTAGTFDLQFLVADQRTSINDTGVLIDNVRVVAQPVAVNPLRLGASIDADPNGQPRADSLGDDLDLDGDDERGVVFNGNIIPGNPFGDVAVTTNIPSGNAFLDGWVDYNQNGTFDDVGEHVIDSAPIANGVNHPAFDAVPATALTGLTHARFRISSVTTLTPRGLAADGEVEDYLIFIGDRTQLLDFGDAPTDTINSYSTLLTNGGPRHQFDPNNVLFLGTGVDIDYELDGQPNVAASGDDSNLTDDEDGVQFPQTALVPGRTYAIPVVANAPGILNAWIDYSQGFVFGFPASEQIATNVALVAGTNTINVTIPMTFPVGSATTTYARFRFSSVAGLGETGLAPDGEVEDYSVVISDLDFGDAPDNSAIATDFATLLASNGARHIITVGGPVLGANVDAELNGQQNATATGDDTLDANDDEDGVTFTTPLIPGDTANASVVVSVAGGLLDGWLDLNGDGDWADFGERVITNFAVVVGTNAVPVPLPFGARIGATNMRFRLSTAGIATSDGLAVDGEVEDYAVTIQGADFGDAPDSFNTRLPPVGNGARHALTASPTIFLGARVDSDIDGQADNFALGDDNDLDGDDEDGVTVPAAILTGSVATFAINYATATTNGVLNAWLDFNGNGVFDVAEKIATDVALTAGQNTTLSVTIPPNAVVGTSFARFRVSSASGLGPVGTAPDGEVEDYRLTIDNGIDFGDAPDPDYSTLLGPSGGGPRHKITGLFLGTTIDAEANGQPQTHSLGDDLNGVDDEDGIFFNSQQFIPGGVTQVSVTATVPAGAPTLNVWIDFRGDGDWDDPGEHAVIDAAIVNGVNIINIPVPNYAVPGLLTHARFRLSTSTFTTDFLGPDGIVPTVPTPTIPDGEVEDYQVIIGNVLDFGDAPDGVAPLTPRYPTLLANGGASTPIVADLTLGQFADAELDGQPTALANGDDTIGSDDEDGVVFSQMVPGGGGTITVVVNSTLLGGFVSAWVDFNGDGDWNDANEWIAAAQPVVNGVNTLAFQVPPNAVVSTSTSPLTFARVRLDATNTPIGPMGFGNAGEVEDYAVTIGPLPTISINDVTVTEPDRNQTVTASFTVTLAVPYSNTVTVNFTTADGTALVSGDDYTATSGTLTFAPGETTKTVTVTVKGDITDEANETFVVNLSNPINATIADGQGQGTITDNDTSTVAYTLVLRNPSLAGTPEFSRDSNGKYRIPAGANFVAEVFVDDLRAAGAAGGVFGAFADLMYSPDLVAWTAGSLTFGSQFTTVQSGTINEAGQLVDEAGGTINPVGAVPVGSDPAQLLFRVNGTISPTATLGAAINIALDAADAVGTHPTIVFGINTEVPASYETEQIIVGEARPWQNPANICDVNNDGRVDQLDVIVVVNAFNNGGSRVLPNPPVAPNLPNPTPGIPGSASFVDLDGDGALTQQDVIAIGLCPKDPLLLEGPELPAAGPVATLTEDDLAPLVTAAIARWEAAGITDAQVTALEAVQFHVTDLADNTLGLAQGFIILIDQSAAGRGWFVDLTPDSDEEFAADGDLLTALGNSLAAGRADLLTVIEHELGHILGLDDLDEVENRASLMYQSLGLGQRKTPALAAIDAVFAEGEI